MSVFMEQSERHHQEGDLASGEDVTGAAPLAESLEDGLQTIFGFDHFRPGQRDVMEAALRGINSLVVMPTGSGKSLCYQLPALVAEGTTLVISPLIALMKDQVDALTAKDIPATFINSSISTREQHDRLYNMEMGRYKIVYIAPERFRSQAFCEAIANTRVSLLAIDEAHCISQWGHDFRPDYLTLARIRDRLGHPPTLSLTATATRQVQRDILAQLNLPEAEIFVYGFERPNLFFEVHDCRSKGDKFDRIKALMAHYDGEPLLIYCATRKQVEEVTRELDGIGISAGMYHGGLSDGERERVQDSFMRDEFPVLVATNAFGMGVDKSDIRAIVHYNIPGSIEAYYQEAGRAGRDGEPAHCLLLFNFADRGIHEFFNEQTYPSRELVERVWDYLSRLGCDTHATGPDQIANHLNRAARGKRINSWAVETVLRQLQRAGHVEWGTRDGFPWVSVLDLARTRDLRVDFEYLAHRRTINDGLLNDVVRYSSGRNCRQLYLLRYFNSRPSFEKGCGHCDVCNGAPEYAKASWANSSTNIISDDPIDVLLQKVLSGVARARGRFGAHIVAGALRGSKAKKVKKTSLVRLSTYGLLSNLKQDDIVTLLDISLRHDLLDRNDHGCISINELGNTVMRDPDQMSEDLREHLEATITPRRRRSRSSWGSSQASSSASSSSSSSSSSKPRVVVDEEPGASEAPADIYSETLGYLQEGKTFDEIANLREVTRQTVLRHLMVLGDRGEVFDLSEHIDADILEDVREAAKGWTYGEPLGPLKKRLRVNCSYEKLKIHLAQVLMERSSDS